MRSGIAFPHRQAHEAAHLRPLMDRLHDVLASRPRRAKVAVVAGGHRPVRGAWNVRVFRGLGDASDASTARALGRRRLPWLRRRGRHQQVNAPGPRWADLLEEARPGAEVSRFGHPALNELGGVRADPEGPLLWLPARGRRSSLAAVAEQVRAFASPELPVLLKPHPLMGRHGPAAAACRMLARVPGVTVAPAAESPYLLLEGCRGVLADGGGLALEAYACGLPVALARAPEAPFPGIHAELAERVPCFAPGEPGLAEWALAPPPPSDAAWARDLLYAPDPRRNDAFAARLRERAAGAR